MADIGVADEVAPAGETPQVVEDRPAVGPPPPGRVARVRQWAALALMVCDFVSASVILWAATVIAPPDDLPALIVPGVPAWLLGAIAFVFLAANGLAYQSRWVASAHATFKDLFIAAAGALGVLTLCASTNHVVKPIAFLLLAVVSALARQFAVRFSGDLLPERVLILGVNEHSVEAAQTLPLVEEPRFTVVGYVDDRQDPGRHPAAVRPILGRFADAASLATDYQVDLVIAALPTAGRSRAVPIVPALAATRTKVIWMEDFYARYFHKIPVHYVDSAWALYGLNQQRSLIYAAAKRLVDVTMATAGLLLAAVSYPFIAGLNALLSPGPVIYSQVRVGRKGKPFRIYKFRTMVRNAEEMGAQFARKHDPRITLVGRLLRKTHLDELPQCWNVLLGHMSMVGPRPERPEFVETLEREIPYFRLRHLVRPGVTGLATVRNGYAATLEESIRKTEYDLYYIKQRNVWLDLSLMLETVVICFMGRNGQASN